MLNRTTKFAAAVALAGALAVTAVATPSYARGGRIAAGIAGFAAGAAIGAATSGYYGPGYYGGYAYGPGYDGGPYAYEPGYVYDSGPDYYARRHHSYQSGCPVQGAYRPDYSFC